MCGERLLGTLQGGNVNITPINLQAEDTSKFNTHNVPRMCCRRKGELPNLIHFQKMYPKQRNLTEASNHRPNNGIHCAHGNKRLGHQIHSNGHCHLKSASQQIPYTSSCILNLAGPRGNDIYEFDY